MKMRIKISNDLCTVLVVLVCYVLTIASQILNSATVRYIMYAISIVIALCLHWVTLKNHQKTILKRYPAIFIFLFIVLFITVFTQLMYNNYLDIGSVIQPIFLVACLIIGYSIVINYGEDSGEKTLKFILTVIVFSAILGVPEYFSNSNFFFPDYGNPWQTYRVASIYGHPIKYATSLTIGFFLVIFLIKKPILKCILLALITFGVFTSMSRSSWIALGLSVIVLLIAVYRKKINLKKIIILLCAAIAVVLFLQTPIGINIQEVVFARFENINNDISSMQRLGSIEYVFNQLGEEFNPVTLLLGHGEDAAKRLMLSTQISISDFSTTDNEYLLILYNYGLIVLVGIVALLIWCFYKFIFKYYSISRLNKCLLCIVISQCICSFFYEITEAKACALPLCLCIGMLLALQAPKSNYNTLS